MNKTYSFLDVTAALTGPGGAITLGSGSGAAEEGIDIETSVDLNNMQIGADGSGQHSLSADKSGRVTVRLLKTSPTNQQLMQMATFQRSSSALHGQNTLVISDTARGDVVSCRQVAFKKIPNLTYASQAGINEWTFDAVLIDPALGS